MPVDVSIYAQLLATDDYLYLLGQEGPLVVVETPRSVVATIDADGFVNNAYGLAAYDGAIWVSTGIRGTTLVRFDP